VSLNGSFTMIRAGAAALAATLVLGAVAPATARDQTGAIVGGLAAGALIGAATQAHAAPGYGYGYADYGYAPAPVAVRPAPVYRVYEEDAPVYATRRTVTYERVPVGYGPARHWHGDWRGDWDGGYGYRGW